MIIKNEILALNRCFLTSILKKLNFGKIGFKFRGLEKKLGALKGNMITKIEISDSYSYFLIPNLKKLNFGKKGGFKGDQKKLGAL